MFGENNFLEKLVGEVSFQTNTVGKPNLRRAAWFVKQPCSCDYGFSGNNFQHQHPEHYLSLFWAFVEKQIPDAYDSVFCSLYVNQTAKVGFHSDDEELFFEEGKTVENQDTKITSISIYGTRTFSIKTPIDKTKKKEMQSQWQSSFRLEPLDIITMQGLFQSEFEHAVLKHHQQCGIRINFTFRQIKNHCKTCPLAQD